MSDLPLPSLSTRERDRRWNGVRRIMQAESLDCLLVLRDPSPMNPPDGYFTNDTPGATVIFPIDGEPTAIGPGAYVAGAWLQAEDRGEAAWVKDWRFRPGVSSIAQVLKEKGFAHSRIGTIGATKGPHMAPNGYAPYSMWLDLLEALPHATFVEIWDKFVRFWLVKSPEELAVFRYAAALCESACQVMLAVTRPGVSEIDIVAAVQQVFESHGCPSGGMILHSGPDNPGWQTPKWRARAQKARVIQEGDIIVSEMFPHVAQIEAQAQMCIAVGEVDEINHRLARIARESYEIALQELRPGRRFEEVALAMNRPQERAGAWHLTPNIHSLNPLESAGPVTEGIHDLPGIERYRDLEERSATGDMVVQAGMTYQLEPNACFGRHRINIGGNVIVTDQGCEPLNELPCQLRSV